MSLLNIITTSPSTVSVDNALVAYNAAIKRRARVLSYLNFIKSELSTSKKTNPDEEIRISKKVEQLLHEASIFGIEAWEECHEEVELVNTLAQEGSITPELLLSYVNTWSHQLNGLRSLLEKIGSHFFTKSNGKSDTLLKLPTFDNEPPPDRNYLYKEINQEVLLLEILLKKTRPRAIPPILVIDPSNHCNYRCKHCHQSNTQDFLHANISESVMNKLAPMMIGVQQAKLFGTGEATLSPTLPLAIELSHHYGCRTEVQTNGSTLNKKNLNLEKVDLLGISFDGSCKRTFEALRAGSNFNNLLQQIRDIKQQNPTCSLYFAMTVSRANLDEIGGVVELAATLGVERVFLNKILPYMPQLIPLSLRKTDKELLEIEIQNAYKIGEREHVLVHNCITVDHEIDDNEPLNKEALIEYLEALPVVKAYRPTPLEDLVSNLEKAIFHARPEELKLLLSDRSKLRGEINQKNTTDQKPLSSKELAQYHEILLKELKETPVEKIEIPYCTSPWVKFFVEAHGGVRPCDPWGTDITSLNTANTFNEAWLSKELTTLRQATIGEAPIPKKCQSCTFVEKHLYIDEITRLLKENDIDITKTNIPKVFDSVSALQQRPNIQPEPLQLQKLSALPEPKLPKQPDLNIPLEETEWSKALLEPEPENGEKCVEYLRECRLQSPFNFSVPLAIQYLERCLVIATDQRLAKHFLFELNLEIDNIDQATRYARELLEAKSLEYHLRIPMSLSLSNRLNYLKKYSDALYFLIPLFCELPTYDIARLISWADVQRRQMNGEPKSDIARYDFIEYAVSVCKESSHELARSVPAFTFVSKEEQELYKIAILPEIKAEREAPLSLNNKHYAPEALQGSVVSPPIDIYEIPECQIRANENMFGVYSRENALFAPSSTRAQFSKSINKETLWISETSGLIADGAPASNYCHWLLDVLPRIFYYRQSYSRPITNWIVGSFKSRFQRETLHSLGILEDQVYDFETFPNIVCEKLICCSDGGPQIRHPSRHAWFQNIHMLRNDIFHTLRISNNSQHRRLFISRKDSQNRTIYGEDELFILLKDTFGFENVLASELSFADQVDLFNQAEIVIGAHGAGLANILFCQNNTSVVEIFNQNYGTAAYAHIAQSLGLDYRYVCGIPLGVEPDQLISRPHYHRADFGNQDFTIGSDTRELLIKHLSSKLEKKTHHTPFYLKAYNRNSSAKENSVAIRTGRISASTLSILAKTDPIISTLEGLTQSLTISDIQILQEEAQNLSQEGVYLEIGVLSPLTTIIVGNGLKNKKCSKARIVNISKWHSETPDQKEQNVCTLELYKDLIKQAGIENKVSIYNTTPEKVESIILPQSVDLLVVNSEQLISVHNWLKLLKENGRLFILESTLDVNSIRYLSKFDLSKERYRCLSEQIVCHGEHISKYNGIIAQQKPQAIFFLIDFIKENNIGRLVEIGTGRGGLTKAIADHASCSILTVDIESMVDSWDGYEATVTRIVDDCFSPFVFDQIKQFTADQTNILFLFDGPSKSKEFNFYRNLIPQNCLALIHDFAPCNEDFEFLRNNNIWLWNESTENELDLVGFCRAENFDSIWKSYVWGAYKKLSI